MATIKKAQKGKMVPSEMFPGKMIPKTNRDRMEKGTIESLSKTTPTIPAKPKKKVMKSGGTLSPSKKSVGKTIGKLNKAKSGTMMKKKAMGGMSVTRLANMKKGGAKKTTMKSGGKMKKCAYGCK